MAADNGCCDLASVSVYDKFVPLYLRVYFDAHIARASRFVLAVIAAPRRLIHVGSYRHRARSGGVTNQRLILPGISVNFGANQ